jgi:maltose/moltooligosaccharide transporter
MANFSTAPDESLPTKQEPRRLSMTEIINMSFGFMGIQMGFALQNGNASRMLSIFGAHVENLTWFWVVAPLTGMLVQPIIGHYSDRTWTGLGRRRPYFLVGAIIACIVMVFIPNSALVVSILPALIVGAFLLALMDTSFNITMEPFRALVADNLPESQRTEGFAIQTFLIGIGAVIGSWLPYVLHNWFGVSDTADAGQISPNVVYAFYIGAACFLATILWTVFTTKEYAPEEYARYHAAAEEKEADRGFFQIFKDFGNMPKTMQQLGLTQFFSWFALFLMWVYTGTAVAHHIAGVSLADIDAMSTLDANNSAKILFNQTGDWVGITFGIYNAVSAIYALFLPKIASAFGRRKTHAISLVLGGLGLISIFFVPNTTWLILSMVGVGIAWASILAMPYSMLAGAIPGGKMGVYMGIFNFFITLPQIVCAIFGGPIVKYIFGGNPIYGILLAGCCMIIAAYCSLNVKLESDTK